MAKQDQKISVERVKAPHTWVDDLTRYAEVLTEETRAKVLGGNVRRIYNLD